MTMDFDEIAEQQGWSTDTRLTLALRFVREQGLGPVLDTFAQQIAASENES